MKPPRERILIISAHADDETFGMGGTILKLQEEGHEIYWLIATQVWRPKWPQQTCIKRKADIERVSKDYGFKETIQWKYHDNLLDTYPTDELQTNLINLLKKLEPSTIFTPGPWDVNFEHRHIFDLVEMSTKPHYSPYIKKIIAYEIPSSTEWSFKCNHFFKPNYYVDILHFIKHKQSKCALYTTELIDFPHPRSLKGVEILSATRGMESGLKFAEAFQLVRCIE